MKYTEINWILHSFSISATFYNNFSSNINLFPLDSYILSIQISINKSPATWNDESDGIRFEISEYCIESIADSAENIKMPSNWILCDHSKNSKILVRSSHKPLQERVNLLLNGSCKCDTEEFELDIPLIL